MKSKPENFIAIRSVTSNLSFGGKDLRTSIVFISLTHPLPSKALNGRDIRCLEQWFRFERNALFLMTQNTCV